MHKTVTREEAELHFLSDGETNSEREWNLFSKLVVGHLNGYCVPQYGDAPNDLASKFSVSKLKDQLERYASRIGTGQRGLEEALRDCLKIAHYACKLYTKLKNVKQAEAGFNLDVQNKIWAWQQAQFGKDIYPPGLLKHMRKELDELDEAPGDPDEIADMFILLIEYASSAGVDLENAAIEKFKRLQNRRFNQPDAEGVIEHIRD